MTSVEVGQVYRDTYFEDGSVAFRVMRLNKKSVRVEPCEPDGWHELRGFMYQYRVPLAQFDRNRHVPIA